MRDRLQATKCARFLKALADPDRLKVVQCLQTGPQTVSGLSRMLGKELANVSHHLAVLRRAGLVQDEKSGKFVVYTLHPKFFRPREPARPAALDLGCCRLELADE